MKAGGCQQHCPVTCGENEMVCSSFDPYTFCPNPDYCTPATYEGIVFIAISVIMENLNKSRCSIFLVLE